MTLPATGALEARALLRRALALVTDGEGARAREAIDAAVALASDSSTVRAIATRLRFALRDFSEALAESAAAVACAADPIEELAALDLRFALAEAAGAYRTAADAGARVLAIDRTAARHERLADLLSAGQSPEASIAQLAQAIALADSIGLRGKAAERLARLGRDEETLRHVRAALALEPALPALRFQAGRLLARLGHVAFAEECLRAALAPVVRERRLDPASPEDLRRALAPPTEPAPATPVPAIAPTEAAPATYVVGPGLDAVVRRIVQPPSLPAGWEFAQCKLGAVVSAFYRNPREAASARLILAHPGAAPAGARTTARFALALQASRRVPSLGALAAALEANVRAHEAAFEWTRAATEEEVAPPPIAPAAPTESAPAPEPAIAIEREVIELPPAEAAPIWAALGELRLWAGDVTEALRCADETLARDPASAVAHRVRGAARLLAGDPAAALPHLDEALRLDGADPETLVFRAEARYRLGDLRGALDDITRGGEAAEDFGDYVAAHMVKLLVLAADDRFPGLPHHAVPEALEQLLTDEERRFDRGSPRAVRAALERALERLRGNRSPTPTYVPPDATDGTPRPLRVRPSPRAPSKAALLLLQTEGPEAALARFAEVHAAHPEAPEPYCYHGELHLYLGEPRRARALFERALELYRGTRWAYIGLAATHVLDGNPREALEVLRVGVERAGGPGPTAFVYRGEAHRLLGEHEAARADLEHATASAPKRVGAWVNLGLLEAALGRRAEAAAIVERLRHKAPALVAEAGRAIGWRPWEPMPAHFEGGERALLEQMLVLLRGNRASSCVTFFTLDGELRVVSSNPALLDERRREMLESARASLEPATSTR